MERVCILSDFDGTITEKDGLYGFFVEYANEEWRDIEKLWVNNKISSKECLQREFECVPNLSDNLIKEYIKTVKIDLFFKDFLTFIKNKNIDFYIVSDGVDYFINSVLENNNIRGMNIISNHFEFTKDKFDIKFPNDCRNCKNDAGTCKCAVVEGMKDKYDKIIYIGDGISDFCVCDKVDILFAKKKLINYCEENKIKHISFSTFNDIIEKLKN